MFIRFDYRCPGCKFQEERFVKKDEMDLQECTECIGSHDGLYFMTRLPPATRTTFRFADTKLKR